MTTKSEVAGPKLELVKLADGLIKAKVAHGKGLFKIGLEKKHGEASGLFLEINGSRKFEIGNDCDTCHFWFKALGDPGVSADKKAMNIPKTLQMPRPVDESMVRELVPLLELLEKGDYAIFEMPIDLSGPYDSNDEGSYFYNTEFLELWDIEDPKEEDILSGWTHYESRRPRIFQHAESGILEKQFDFVVPLANPASLNEENIRIYQSMIANGDRPRILLFGLYQRPIPQSVSRGTMKTIHSYMAGFVLDGHHKLAAYRRAGVRAQCLVFLSLKASKYLLLKEEGASPKNKFEERLAALASAT